MATRIHDTYHYKFLNPPFINSKGDKMPNDSGWQTRHMQALRLPVNGGEAVIGNMIGAWALYADTHKARFDSGIGEDYVLGPAWAGIGAHIRTLLNGECGRFDCGTLDGFIYNTLTAEGFHPDEL